MQAKTVLISKCCPRSHSSTFLPRCVKLYNPQFITILDQLVKVWGREFHYIVRGAVEGWADSQYTQQHSCTPQSTTQQHQWSVIRADLKLRVFYNYTLCCGGCTTAAEQGISNELKEFFLQTKTTDQASRVYADTITVLKFWIHLPFFSGRSAHNIDFVLSW